MGGVIWNIFKNSEKDGEKIKSDGEQVKLKRARENAKKRGREEEEREREREMEERVAVVWGESDSALLTTTEDYCYC